MKVVEYTPSKYVTLNLVHQIDHNNAVVKFDGIVQSDENNVVYFILGTDKKSFKVPLKDMSFKVTSPMTDISGMLKGQIREYAPDGSFIDNLTDIFPVLIRDSIDGDIIEITDPRIDLWFDAMQKLYNEVKDEYESGALNGKDGVGIKSIEKTKSEGLVDTYTITLTDDSTFVYSVTNGRNGIDGKSAYELAVENGFKGTEQEWLESLRYDHSDEFKQLADQVKLDAKSAEDSATKAESAMNKANTIAQTNIEAINKAGANAQNAITTSKDSAVKAVQDAQSTAEEAIGDKQIEAVQAVDTAKTSATTEITEQKENVLTEITNEKNSATEAIETGKTEALTDIATDRTGALTDIETAKNEAIEEIENTGVPLEDIEKLAIKETAQGNPTIMSDSADWRLQDLKVYGQSKQDSTTGAQLLNVYSNGVNNGVTWNCEGSVVTFSGTILEDSVNRINAVIHNKDTYKAGKTYYVKSFTNDVAVDFVVRKQDDELVYLTEYTVEGTEKELYCRCIINNTINKPGVSINKVAYIAITENAAMSEWEPYTGGKPSPSPDYPQEIISKEVSSIIVSNGASESQTITLQEPITLRGIPVSSGGNVTIDEQQYISDVICEKDGVIGVERNIEAFSLAIADMNNNENFPGWKPLDVVDKIIPPQSADVQITTILCTIQSRTIYARRDIKLLYFASEELGKTQTEFKEQYPDLSVNFAAISYEPTFEPLPEDVQAQYKALKLYYPNTVIQTGCWNEVEYVADTKTWIENKINGVTELALGIGGK